MENIKFVIEKSARIDKLIDELYAKMPEIESARGVLVTESYKATEALPIINRRSAAFAHILRNIPIIIRDGELSLIHICKAEAEKRDLYITHKVIARQSEDIEWFARLNALGKDKLR